MSLGLVVAARERFVHVVVCLGLAAVALACAADPPTHFWTLSVHGASGDDRTSVLDSTVAILEQRAALFNGALRSSGAVQRIRHVRAMSDGRIEIGVSGANADEVDLSSLLAETEVQLRLLSYAGDPVGPVLVTNNDFEDMIPNSDAGEAGVMFELTRTAGDRLESATAEAVGSRMGVIMAGEVISDPVIQGPIGRRARINIPNMSEADVDRLILAVRWGLLPGPVVVDDRSSAPLDR